MLAEFAAAVVAEVESLRAWLRQPPDGFWPHAVVAKHDDRAHLVARHDGKRPLEAFHETFAVCEPDAKALEFHEKTQRVEADLFGNLQFALHLGEAFLAAQLLPLVHAVGATGGHVVAAANPWLGAIPFPRLLFRPGTVAATHCFIRLGGHLLASILRLHG